MKLNKLITAITGSLLAITVISGALLSSPSIYAGSSTRDEVSVRVPVSCTMSSTGTTSHTANILNGTYRNNIGATTIKVLCNDGGGFAIYATGYTDGAIGEEYSNQLLGTTYYDQYAISTGINTGLSADEESSWAMRLTATSDSGDTTSSNALAIDSDSEGSFASYHTVPNSYTKVAHKNSNTNMDATTGGATITATYAAYISKTQPADTYTGQVKYILVYPSIPPEDDEDAVNITFYGSGLYFDQEETETENTLIFRYVCDELDESDCHYEYESGEYRVPIGADEDGEWLFQENTARLATTLVNFEYTNEDFIEMLESTGNRLVGQTYQVFYRNEEAIFGVFQDDDSFETGLFNIVAYRYNGNTFENVGGTYHQPAVFNNEWYGYPFVQDEYDGSFYPDYTMPFAISNIENEAQFINFLNQALEYDMLPLQGGDAALLLTGDNSDSVTIVYYGSGLYFDQEETETENTLIFRYVCDDLDESDCHYEYESGEYRVPIGADADGEWLFQNPNNGFSLSTIPLNTEFTNEAMIEMLESTGNRLVGQTYQVFYRNEEAIFGVFQDDDSFETGLFNIVAYRYNGNTFENVGGTYHQPAVFNNEWYGYPFVQNEFDGSFYPYFTVRITISNIENEAQLISFLNQALEYDMLPLQGGDAVLLLTGDDFNPDGSVWIVYDANADGDNVTNMPESPEQHSYDWLDNWYYLSCNVPVRPGYTFLGWEYNGLTFEPCDYIAVSGRDVTVTVYAQWEPSPYIYYDSDGDVYDMPDPTECVQDSECTISSATPDRVDEEYDDEFGIATCSYSFNGWTEDGEGLVDPGDSIYIGWDDITLWADWNEDCNYEPYVYIHYESEGDVYDMPDDPTECEQDSVCTISSATPDRVDEEYDDEFGITTCSYSFNGWKYYPGGDDPVELYQPGDSIYIGWDSITLWADWNEDCNYEPDPVYIYYDSTGDGVYDLPGPTECEQDSECEISSTTPGRYNWEGTEGDEGLICSYSFNGWTNWEYSDDDDDWHDVLYQPGESIYIGSGGFITLWADWNEDCNFEPDEPESVYIYYESDGDAYVTPDPTECEPDSECTITDEEPTRYDGDVYDGASDTYYTCSYSFNGWTFGDEPIEIYQPGESITMGAENITLYADWTENCTVYIHYESEGDVYDMPEDFTECEPESECEISSTTPGRYNWEGTEGDEGLICSYSFNGWINWEYSEEEDDWHEVLYQSGDPIYIGYWNVILYADWTENCTVYIHYESEGDVYDMPEDPTECEPESECEISSATPSRSDDYNDVPEEGGAYICSYSFNGWINWEHSEEDDWHEVLYQPGDTISIGSNGITLWADWTKNCDFEPYEPDPEGP